jgi:small subunit ribosomal protein S4
MREAEKGIGMAGEKLLVLLERRLDNVIFRAGFATTRRGARQLVSHGNFLLNGKRVDIPSIRVKVGDEVVVRPKSQKNGYFKALSEIVKDAAVQKSGWLSVSVPKMTVKVTGLPARADITEDINEQLIVEYYSR